MRRGWLATLVGAVAWVVLVPVSAPATAPQIVDAQGDANGLSMVNGTSATTEPASYAAGDLLSATLETLFEGEGEERRPVAVRVRVRTLEAPSWTGPSVGYGVRGTIIGCEIWIGAYLHGVWPDPFLPDDPETIVEFDGQSCGTDGGTWHSHERWTSEVDEAAREMVVTIPLDSLTAFEGVYLAPGRTLEAPIAEVMNDFSSASVQGNRVRTYRLDESPPGTDFTIGAE